MENTSKRHEGISLVHLDVTRPKPEEGKGGELGRNLITLVHLVIWRVAHSLSLGMLRHQEM